MQGDIASNMVTGVDQFLMRKLEESVSNRSRFWHREFSSWQAYEQSLATNRQRLAHILGVRDQRSQKVELELIATTGRPALRARGQRYEVLAVRWPAFGDVTGEGLLLRPAGRAAVANIIALPDADQTPEQLAGIANGLPPESQFARRLAESGCQVLVPTLISRHVAPERQLSDREFIYRPAYELGRHIIGYEMEKVLAGIDWMSAQHTGASSKIGIIGWAEGGLLAFYAAALDTRITAACISGYFDERERVIWQQPIERNVFGLLEEFGDAEVAAMIAPRSLILEAARGPELSLPGGDAYTPAQRGKGAPGSLKSPELASAQAEFERARALIAGLQPASDLELVVSGDGGQGAFGSAAALGKFLRALGTDLRLAPEGPALADLWTGFEPAAREAEQVHELDRHNQMLLAQSPRTRQEFMKNLDTASPGKLQQSAEWFRNYFYREVIGRLDEPLLPPNPRSRLLYTNSKWTGYEVVLDVFPDVIANGILLVPQGIQPGERRPLVVCQHGLEGRPEETITGDSHYYHDFAAHLCEQGFVTFSPQGLFIFEDRFRALQRKANPLGKTLYSIMVPQNQQITDWLKTLPFVDPSRIAFYGLSYGGKSAMRVPALVTNYCLSICSGDFNDWVWKCSSTLSPYSYVWLPEYEIFEFDLGNTFNYSEIAALLAPRPFMVERGHFDGVAPDDRVAYEFAKVRYLYEARLGIGERCRIEWFNGPHTIHGVGTFKFLHQYLNWPERRTLH